MTKCPHCGKELELVSPAEHNTLIYGKPSVSATACCGFAVRVTRIQTLRYEACEAKEDDWLVPIKPKPGSIRDDGAILTTAGHWAHAGRIWIEIRNLTKAKQHGWIEDPRLRRTKAGVCVCKV